MRQQESERMTDIPDAEQAYADMGEQLKKMRLSHSTCCLLDPDLENPLLTAAHTTRTFIHPTEGIVTLKEGQRIIAGCGHQIESMNQIGGRCVSKTHRGNPSSGITCERCIRSCARCGRTFCSACTRYDPDSQLYYCRPCNRARAIGRIFRAMGLLTGLFLFELPEQQESERS